MSQKTFLSRILSGICPACHQGKMWNHSAYKLSEMTKMNKRCPHCHTSLEPEPAFYTGAMYVGYALAVALIGVVFVAGNVLSEVPNYNRLFWIIIGLVVVLAPLNLRLSRNIWANVFIKKKD